MIDPFPPIHRILYSAGGLVLVIILRGRMQLVVGGLCRMCCLVRGDEQSCRIHALAAFLVPFGGRRMDGSDGYPLIRDPAMQTFSSTTYVRIIFVVLLFAALKKKR